MPSAIVANGSAYRLRHVSQFPENLVQGATAEFRILPRGSVQIVHVSPMMAIMMDFHGLGVDVRLVLTCGIRQWVKLKRPIGCLRRCAANYCDRATDRESCDDRAPID